MSKPSQTNRSAGARIRTLYVRILLRLLPILVSLFRPLSKRIAAETAYLEPGFTFQLTVQGTSLSCVCRRKPSGGFKRVPPARVARDVEPGSGLASADPSDVTIDYVIAFRSLAYAFDCFSAKMTLSDALAQRAFSTRGPNRAGVARTYMFTALLRMFFGWRGAYRNAPRIA